MEILNLEGYQNLITGSSYGSFAEKRDFFPIGQSGEASRRRVCYQRGLPRLVNRGIQICTMVYPLSLLVLKLGVACRQEGRGASLEALRTQC